MAILRGRVQSVRHASEGFNVLAMLVHETDPPVGVKVSKACGPLHGLSQIRSGVSIELCGSWTDHPRYGQQFTINTWRPWAWLDSDVAGFLSVCVRGLHDPQIVKDVVDAWGPKAFERLGEDDPLENTRLAVARECWKSTIDFRDIANLLRDDGLSSMTVSAIMQAFGHDAKTVLNTDPYRLMEVVGVQFAVADRMGMRLGVPPQDKRRVAGAVLWALREAVQSGHLFLPRGELASRARPLVAAIDSVDEAMALLVERKAVIVEPGTGAYLPEWHHYEQASAAWLASGIRESPLKVDASAFIQKYEVASQITLSEDQQQAIQLLASNRVMVLTGLPGTGKTTVVRAFVRMFEAAKVDFMLMAPTGIAAKRLSGVTERPASTIHRALKYDGTNWFHSESNRLVVSAVIVDEMSMVDQELLYRLLSSLRHDTIVAFVGDDAQLPSVGPGFVLREMITCPVLPRVRLTTIFRQSDKGAIVLNAHRIDRGESLPLHEHDVDSEFQFVPTASPDVAADLIVEMAAKLKGRNANFQVLSPMYDGVVGVTNLNERLRDRLNPFQGQMEYKKGDLRFRVGDRLMVIQNDYKLLVYNGDVGKLVRITKDDLVVRIHGVGNEPDSEVWFPQEQAFKLRLAYAVTVHKCVAPETLVETPRGLVRVTVVTPGEPLATANGHAQALAPMVNPISPMVELITEDGYALRATLSHGVDVWHPSHGYVRQEASQVALGDYVRLRLGAEFPDNPCHPMPEALPAVAHDVRARRYRTPLELDDQVAEFLGMFVADGTLYDKGFRLAKRHEAYADRFACLCQSLFGVDVKRYFKLGAHHVEVSSTYLATWLGGISGLQPKQKALPDAILASSVQVQAAFLRGLFEDGSAHARGDTLDHLELRINPPIPRIVRVMLLRQGIISGALKSDPDGPVYVYGQNASRFAERVGFISPLKVLRNQLPAGKQTRYRVPVLRSELLALADANGGRAAFYDNTEKNAFCRGTMSRHTLHKLLERTPNRISVWADLFDRMRFHHSKIQAIRPYLGPSICVEVPDGQQYVQDGFCGWNCQGSEFDTIVMPLVCAHGRMLQRNLFYTAITRAKKKVWVLGEEVAVQRAIQNATVQTRNTRLAECIAREADSV